MLKQRLVSGVVLAAIVVAALIGLNSTGFAIAAAILFLLAGWEWAALTSFAEQPQRAIYCALLAVLMGLAWLILDSAVISGFLFIVVLIWLFLLAFLTVYSHSEGAPARWQLPLALSGLIFLLAAWIAFVKLHEIHTGWMFYLLLLCVVADSMAYLVGKMWGKTKLAPDLSPGKTREGMLGGAAGVLALAVVVALWVGLPTFQAISFVLLSVLAGLVSVEGDLFESLIKREAGVKDSGKLLPGHGGVFDRFDSHIAAAPLFYLGLTWILV